MDGEVVQLNASLKALLQTTIKEEQNFQETVYHADVRSQATQFWQSVSSISAFLEDELAATDDTEPCVYSTTQAVTALQSNMNNKKLMMEECAEELSRLQLEYPALKDPARHQNV
jgi:hypothetical protein|uniref:Uncharacterized protein n=1 Tax=Eutreptiella gymnastica TaxID=73025 RepID=A0A7S4CU08_9EUGL|mmetsp:Transcript_34202/g.56159  ORF Transcript_34202/g.56159 Transcript_34202/m.56159 type:complete len:115 (+) Transcript_34202:36-380(+)|eukprot:CAMPEP_0174286432 /NCGR_PEP_ID=MMETSP0809-20121228/11831_1 /TAXON_ID=73025 ORGANISM="Eutreptiella gymnastica-like, Strain CCMP1594" /NCGR_SAMPLE_ID=MMETSP0809 /ASSEMBLY_ACC=CAM_ASM_000658 /LENGTH=114 /DNA_ID=CAMNT_0015382505 /DNA_START=36 /DNA_END=380 /DNA_ORIENTATION=+